MQRIRMEVHDVKFSDEFTLPLKIYCVEGSCVYLIGATRSEYMNTVLG